MEREKLVSEFATTMKMIMRTSRIDFPILFQEYVPFNEFLIIRMLDEENKLMVSQLAQRLNVSNSHVAMGSEKLVKKGFIVRERSVEDRRVVFLSITTEGQELVKKMQELIQEYFRTKLKGITDEEIKLVITIFNKYLN